MARKRNEKNLTLAEPIKKGQEQIVVNNIQVRSADRSRKDIGDWKNAVISAESTYSPSRTRLYDLYTDILQDLHLTGLMTKRIEPVLNKTLIFQNKSGQKVDAFDTLIESDTFRDICEQILLTPFWGISGLEFIPGKELEFKPIPRKHIKPKWGVIATEQSDTDGFSYVGVANLFIVGKPDDLGLLLKAAPYALLKRGNLADWGQFIEIFGQPIRVIKYDAFDRQAKVELKEVLDESGSSLALMIPKTADFEIMDGKSSNANGELQDKFKNALNDEMSIGLLGNVETTGNSNGGSNAKSKTQREEQLEITKSDIKYLVGKLNCKQFLDILKSYGYPTEGGKFIVEGELNIAVVKEQVAIVAEVKAMGVPVEDDYIYELTGIPKPKNYNELKAKAEEKNEASKEQQPKIGKVPIKPKKEVEQELFYDTEETQNWLFKFRQSLADFFDPPR